MSTEKHLTERAEEMLELLFSENENAFHTVSGAVWEAIGPDAVEDWREGGERRVTHEIAHALLDNDAQRLGWLLLDMAIPYLNRVAEQPHMWRDAA